MSASRFIPDVEVNVKAVGVAYIVLALAIIFSPAFDGIFSSEEKKRETRTTRTRTKPRGRRPPRSSASSR